MANPWFRMYSEFATDPKVQMLSEVDQRRYLMVLCLRCSNGDVTLQDDQVAFQLRISNEEWAATKAVLVSKSLITEHNQPSAWDKRQYSSDSSAARVAAHRERKKKECNVTVTPPDTDTDTDTEEEQEKKALVPSDDATKGYPQAFDACWAKYPKRAGGNSKKAAYKAWAARIREGATAEALDAAVQAYAAEMIAKGKVGTEYVKQAATFFGPNGHWVEVTQPGNVHPIRKGLGPDGKLLPGYFWHADDFDLPVEKRRILSHETHDVASGYTWEYLRSKGRA